METEDELTSESFSGAELTDIPSDLDLGFAEVT